MEPVLANGSLMSKDHDYSASPTSSKERIDQVTTVVVSSNPNPGKAALTLLSMKTNSSVAAVSLPSSPNAAPLPDAAKKMEKLESSALLLCLEVASSVTDDEGDGSYRASKRRGCEALVPPPHKRRKMTTTTDSKPLLPPRKLLPFLPAVRGSPTSSSPVQLPVGRPMPRAPRLPLLFPSSPSGRIQRQHNAGQPSVVPPSVSQD